jgi:hypothetical protein
MTVLHMARDTYICLSTAKQHNEPRHDQRRAVIICLVSTVPWRHAALMRLRPALAINRGGVNGCGRQGHARVQDVSLRAVAATMSLCNELCCAWCACCATDFGDFRMTLKILLLVAVRDSKKPEFS